MKILYVLLGIVIGAFLLFIPGVKAKMVEVADRLTIGEYLDMGWGHRVDIVEDHQNGAICYVARGNNGSIAISCLK